MTSDELIQTWPEEWQLRVRSLVDTPRQSMPTGYEERCDGKMILWVIPHQTYPGGYHCDPKSPLPSIWMAVNKGGLSVYNFGKYMVPEIMEAYRTSYEADVGRKADMGKSCIKFKRPDHVRESHLGDLARRISVQDYLAHYAPMDPRNR